MSTFSHLAGIYTAAVTPLRMDDTIALDDLAPLLSFLARRGCHGALLFGTTGEGPSFAANERQEALRAALAVRQEHPGFRLLAGTGTPSLEETIGLTRTAFDLGLDGVIVLPPYYFRQVSDDGLFEWFSAVLRRAVPVGGALLGYHIPPVTGVPLSFELLARLQDAFPDRFAGLKDSSADPDHARALGSRFGDELLVLNGNDRLLSLALDHGASGGITNLSSLQSPDLRQVWDAHLAGRAAPAAQARLDAGRQIVDRYPPAPPFLKALLPRLHGLPYWTVRAPLQSLPQDTVERAVAEYCAAVG